MKSYCYKCLHLLSFSIKWISTRSKLISSSFFPYGSHSSHLEYYMCFIIERKHHQLSNFSCKSVCQKNLIPLASKYLVHVWTMETINMYISRVILEPLYIMEKHALIRNFFFFIQSCHYYMAKSITFIIRMTWYLTTYIILTVSYIIYCIIMQTGNYFNLNS